MEVRFCPHSVKRPLPATRNTIGVSDPSDLLWRQRDRIIHALVHTDSRLSLHVTDRTSDAPWDGT